MEKGLRFSKNWNNKLAGEFFTTFRPRDVRRFIIGDTLPVFLGGQLIFYAEIVDITDMYLNDLSETDARIDSGKSKHDLINFMRDIYKPMKIDFSTRMVSRLLLRRLPQQKDYIRTSRANSVDSSVC